MQKFLSLSCSICQVVSVVAREKLLVCILIYCEFPFQWIFFFMSSTPCNCWCPDVYLIHLLSSSWTKIWTLPGALLLPSLPTPRIGREPTEGFNFSLGNLYIIFLCKLGRHSCSRNLIFTSFFYYRCVCIFKNFNQTGIHVAINCEKSNYMTSC